INLADTDGAAAASKKAFIIIGGTDSLLILGICFLWILSGSFTINKIHVSVTSVFALSAFILMASAAFAKAGCMPFHSWFADVAEEAPTPVVAYLPASLDKLLGIYLLARLSLNIFEMTALSNTILMFAGSATILYASSLAIFQTRMKRLLGYCAVSQVGYMVVGIGTGNPIGIAGGLLHMVNHALYKSCLFLSGGVVEKKTGTSDLEKLGGLVKLMPWTFATFLVASLSVTGVPPFNGFASKWMVYQGIIESAKHGSRLWVLWLIAAMFGSAFTLASFTKLLHAVFMGPVRPEMKKIREGHWLLIVPPAILAVLCLGFGLFAFSSVLPGLVAPIVGGVALTGLWNPLVAAGLLLAGLAMGWLLFLAGRGGSVRTAKPFIGGEDIETFSHYPGVDCYETVKDTKLFGSLTGADRTGRFDVYAQAGALVNKLSQAFGRLHNGVLPTYLVWPLLGMIAMFAVFFGKF
ncbi:MAG: proton-conducting transporter membrane subunit, partial [Candidatus Omnitrophota bacterium]